MTVAIQVRHEQVYSTPPIRDTYDFLSMVISVGDNMNTGFNGIIAQELSIKLDDERESKNENIILSQEHYEIIVKDVSRLNFLKLGIGGVMVANYLRDIIQAGQKEQASKEGKVEK